jgi:hypothetical protein
MDVIRRLPVFCNLNDRCHSVYSLQGLYGRKTLKIMRRTLRCRTMGYKNMATSDVSYVTSSASGLQQNKTKQYKPKFHSTSCKETSPGRCEKRVNIKPSDTSSPVHRQPLEVTPWYPSPPRAQLHTVYKICIPLGSVPTYFGLLILLFLPFLFRLYLLWILVFLEKNQCCTVSLVKIMKQYVSLNVQHVRKFVYVFERNANSIHQYSRPTNM